MFTLLHVILFVALFGLFFCDHLFESCKIINFILLWYTFLEFIISPYNACQLCAAQMVVVKSDASASVALSPGCLPGGWSM